MGRGLRKIDSGQSIFIIGASAFLIDAFICDMIWIDHDIVQDILQFGHGPLSFKVNICHI